MYLTVKVKQNKAMNFFMNRKAFFVKQCIQQAFLILFLYNTYSSYVFFYKCICSFKTSLIVTVSNGTTDR